MPHRPRSLRIGAYLRHILDAIERIHEYTKGLGEDAFLQTPIVQDAVIRNLEVIGEACRNILRHHPEFAAEHADIPWRSPYEMRNALSHGYFTIELGWTWTTIRNDLPPFEARIRTLLGSIEQP